MKFAIISLTENGRIISEKIAVKLSENHTCTRYSYEKHSDENTRIFSSLSVLVSDIFHEVDGLIFISACGIAVRMIAPHIISKTTDPAVISVDEQGKFAVSLLSGHIGGGNALAEKIAGIIGAVPVITTATDIGKKFSPDSFACANGLHILETDIAKDIAAAVVNGEKIGIFSDYPYVNLPHEFFGDSAENGISISCDTAKIPFKNTLHLVPKNIIIGVGCRKNTDSDLLSEFILNMLKVNDIPLYRVVGMHTIDIKKDETAILNFADRNNIPLKFYSAKELMQVEGEFSHSAFVAKITGADNICERSAAVGGNTLIVRKHAENGMTFAAAESEIILDFERKIL